jgi:sugar phosphate isomerase/epimerase
VIRIGPAAAPRWFDQDLSKFEQFLDLIVAAGGSAIEFVVLPGTGTEELGRVHLLDPDLPAAVDLAHARGFTINLHAPLPSEYRMSEWANDRIGYNSRFASVLNMVTRVEAGQATPPILVMHAAAGMPALTAEFLLELLAKLSESGSDARLSLELRSRSTADDDRFDRDLALLAEFVSGLNSERVGICWDIAHDWENGGRITQLTPSVLDVINHVHLHDSRGASDVHGPLGYGVIPWQGAIRQLVDAKWEGAVTLEIRYRYAIERGDPWRVLTRNLLDVRAILAGE